MIKYSFVVPIYNDSDLAESFCDSFKSVFQSYLNTTSIKDQVELIFVDDGSKKSQCDILEEVCLKYDFVKVLFLTRNFGQHIAISCGYREAMGDYVGMINVDMQEHPEQIPLFLDKIKSSDNDIIYGLRQKRTSGITEKLTSMIFNMVMNFLTKSKTQYNVSTLRVVSRDFLDTYNSLTEKSRFLPGLENWLGFKAGYVNVNHEERKKGKSSYNFSKRLSMALDSIVSFSDFPLKLTSVLGMVISLLGFFLTLIIAISKLYFIDFLPGYVSTVSLIMLVGGGQIFVTGLVGIYLGRVLREVQNRPLYVIRKRIN